MEFKKVGITKNIIGILSSDFSMWSLCNHDQVYQILVTKNQNPIFDKLFCIKIMVLQESWFKKFIAWNDHSFCFIVPDVFRQVNVSVPVANCVAVLFE